MNNANSFSEFKNVVIKDDNINFGITINSVGYKMVHANEKKNSTTQSKDFKYQYKKGKVSNEFKLIYITNGIGYVCFDNAPELEISKGKILLISPNQKYTYYHLNTSEWKEYFIRFETDMVFSMLIRKFFPIENSIIDIGFNEELMKLFHRAIESEVGQGSEFWFTARLKKQPDGGQVEMLPPPDFSNVRALIVDDNATNRQILVTQLTSWGMRPAEVPDGTAALEALLQAQEAGDPFRITIIDMHMPCMNGETLGLAVKADARISDTHLVMLTSMGIKSDFRRLKEIGFDVYLNKPTRRHELKNALSQALSGRGLDQPQSIETHHSAQDIINLFAESKARILLAEDNIINQQVALGILNKLGLRADAVANGAEAVTAVKTLPYDLILMDVQMPVMDGLEATKIIRNYELEIKNQAQTGDSPSPFVIPIIAMTAHAMQGDREKFLAVGMTDYISKPVSLHGLVDRLEKWLPKIKDEGESIKDEREPGITLEVKSDDPPVWNRQMLMECLMDDEDMVKMILDDFLVDIPLQIQALKAFQVSGDLSGVERQIHTIKGTSANVGAERLQSVAFEMEKAAIARDMTAVDSFMHELERQFDCLKEVMQFVKKQHGPIINYHTRHTSDT